MKKRITFFLFLMIFFQYLNGSKSMKRHDSSNRELLAEKMILSRPGTESIHRFFDTNPISPSSHYLAINELPSSQNSFDTTSKEINFANVTLINIQNKEYEVIDQTTAWGSQLGSQLQWGKTDQQLFYNILLYNHSFQRYDLKGIMYNMETKTKIVLSCPIYHINTEGTKSISSDLLQIAKTQKGYGIDWRENHENIHILFSESVIMNDLRSGSCRVLYTIHEIAKSVGIDSTQTPTYGFHTKWSSDSRYILFVMRTMERGVRESLIKPRPKVRVQHLFVLGAEVKMIRYLFTWSSKAFLSPSCEAIETCKDIIILRDGNHPNWIPDTLKISMNLETKLSSQSQLSSKNRRKEFAVVVFDFEKVINSNQSSMQLFHQHFLFHALPHMEECINLTARFQTIQSNPTMIDFMIVWKAGSGHPSIESSGRYLLMDKYTKESGPLETNQYQYAPILLIDLFCQIQYTLSEALINIQMAKGSISWLKSFINGKEDRSWRCDLHPVITKDRTMVVFNSLNDHGHRQVSILQVNREHLDRTNKLFTAR